MEGREGVGEEHASFVRLYMHEALFRGRVHSQRSINRSSIIITAFVLKVQHPKIKNDHALPIIIRGEFSKSNLCM